MSTARHIAGMESGFHLKQVRGLALIKVTPESGRSRGRPLCTYGAEEANFSRGEIIMKGEIRLPGRPLVLGLHAAPRMIGALC